MKITKKTLTVNLEALSQDSFPAMLLALAEMIDREQTKGKIVADDGDTTIWSTRIAKAVNI